MYGWGSGGDGYAPAGHARAAAARRVAGWRKGQDADFFAIDRVCCLLGIHMAEIFGDVYWNTRLSPLEDDPEYRKRDNVVRWARLCEREAADPELRERRLARRRERYRERYHNDPEFRERQLARDRVRDRKRRERVRQAREAA
jgi:hypothetical protein